MENEKKENTIQLELETYTKMVSEIAELKKSQELMVNSVKESEITIETNSHTPKENEQTEKKETRGIF